MNSDRYNKLGEFLKERLGGKAKKICVDGGFTCPNRDGACGSGGCVFCTQPKRTEIIDAEHIRKQVKRGILAEMRKDITGETDTDKVDEYEEKADKEKANQNEIKLEKCKEKAEKNTGKAEKNTEKADKNEDRFIVFFQNYSNTYAEIGELREKYNAALCDDRIVGLAVATRPDCINGEIVALLGEYTKKYYVWVEMGLQTSDDDTANLINRGYKTEQFSRAAKLLATGGIDVVAHLIFGLPFETDETIKQTIKYVNNQKISGVKIHSLYVVRGTRLFDSYQQKQYLAQEFDDYIRRLTYAITHLRRDIIIHRITGDCERGQLVAPSWNNRKKLIRNALEKNLERDNLFQGCFCEE